MDAHQQGVIISLRTSLQLVFCSRSAAPELYTWCQLAFPGSCYLSCATSTGTSSFATTSNLTERTGFEVSLVAGQDAPADHTLQGSVLHNSWPSRHPDLATLRGGSHWDAVIVVSIPSADTPAAAPAAAPAGPLEAEAAAVYTNGQMDHQADGSSTSPLHSDSSSSATEGGHQPLQAGAIQHAAESVLILGLRGHRHDLERTLVNLQMLANQLTPVMQAHRQQLIEQAMHAVHTAHASATAVEDGGMAHMGTVDSYTIAAEDSDTNVDGAATAVVAAATANTAGPDPTPVPSPFAGLDGPPLPVAPMPGPGAERPGRRREQSGTLPLDQILSRNPSPVSPIPNQSMDRHFLDGISRQSSAQLSRLGSGLSRDILPAGQALPAAATSATVEHSSQEEGMSLAHRAAVATAAGTVTTAALPRNLATVHSGQGLPLDPQSPVGSVGGSSSADPQDSDSEPSRLVPTRGGQRDLLMCAGEEAEPDTFGQEAVTHDVDSQYDMAESHDSDLAAQLESEEAASRNGRQQQHPWLLYFYDRDMEQDFSRYHARQMLKVDAVSLLMALGIYIRLGFASGHAYAFQVPVTFGAMLFLLVTMLCGVICMQDKWTQYRQHALRMFAAVYVGVNALYLYPKYAKEAFSPSWLWLLRYSNTWVLLMTAVGLMVRFHVHLPLQLINFAVSAAILPHAICKAGFAEYVVWKCITVGVLSQFSIGVVLSSTLVALNEKRLRGMYLRSITLQSSVNGKNKMD